MAEMGHPSLLDQVALAPHAGLSDGLAVGEVSVAPLAEAR